MSTITKDLGMVTAYAYAVSKGYTGTEDDFAVLMASYADVAERAEESATAAGASASVAEQAKAEAVLSASAAASSASTASTKASEAASSASSAAGSANTATTKANEASTSATNAASAASAAATSATNAGASATAAASSATAASNAQTASETAQDAAEEAQAAAETAAASVSESAAQIAQNTEDIGALESAVNDPTTGLDAKAPAIYKTASGAVASFSDGVASMPVKALIVSGVAEGETVTVVRTGLNLIDNSAGAWESGTINASGNNASGSGTRTKNYYPIKALQTLTLSGLPAPASTQDFRFFFYDEDFSYLSYKNYFSTWTITDSRVAYFKIRNSENLDISNLMLEYGSSASEYEPYNCVSFSYPEETVTTLYGNNNIWSNTGDVNVEYCADTKLYVDIDASKELCVDIDAIKARIEDIENSTGLLPSNYPSYSTEYDTTLNTLRAKSATNPTTSFVFMADLHFTAEGWGYREDIRKHVLYHMDAMCQLATDYPIKAFALGGDYMQSNADVASIHEDAYGYGIIADVNSYLSKASCPTIAIEGNHEADYFGGSGNYSPSNNGGMTNVQLWNYLDSKYNRAEIKFANRNIAYQIIDVDNIMLLYISSTVNTFSQTMQDGFDIALSANANNYPIIVIGHFAHNRITLEPFPVTSGAIDYLLGKGKEVIAYIGGHNHADSFAVYNNVLIVSCMGAGYWATNVGTDGVEYNKTDSVRGSASSIFTVDKTLGKLFCTRFGCGVDREFNYNTTSGAIGIVS